MFKSITRLMCQGFAAIFSMVAMTNIGTTSLFMMYQPEPPKETVKNMKRVDVINS